ncbi:MAG: TldD/PmbA family protein [Anaerolineae bacterium]
MLGETEIRKITEQVLAISTADQTEVLFWGEESQLTRFANSAIHQNVAEANTEVRVRVVLGKKIGVASTNELGAEALERVVETATTVAALQPDNPDFKSLPGPAAIAEGKAYVEATASATPEQRAHRVGAICRQARDKGLNAAGAFKTGCYEIAVANSLGLFAYHPATVAHLNTVIMSDTGSGFASRVAVDVREIDAEAVGTVAVDKALRSRNPVEIEPGEYTVILEEEAVNDMVFFLGYMGFGARQVQEGRSFMCGKFGEEIVDRNISIWDDGLDQVGLVMPFDFEGVPKRRVDLIKNGVAEGVVYDSYTAGKEEGKKSTGHALPAPNTFGPFPFNLFMARGTATKEEMLASTERGIWVTRFHYTNIVHPLKTIITGMTRDGTFFIEKGELVKPIKNMRFTQSILEALSNVEMVGKEGKLARKGWSGAGSYAPALKISTFRFTGKTQF